MMLARVLARASAEMAFLLAGVFGTRAADVGAMFTGKHHLPLSADSWVEVRSREEILATLDEQGRLDGMPFMPEMLRHCGKRLRVSKRAHKTCDTITYRGGRSVDAAVHLENVRCDGSAHGGCQAECLTFWKEAWLKPVDGPSETETRAAGCDEAQLRAATQRHEPGEDEPRFVCQATALLEASRALSPWDVRQYVEDFRSGNVQLATFARGLLYRVAEAVVHRSERLERRLHLSATVSRSLMRAYDGLQRVLPHGVPYPRRVGTVPPGERTPSETNGELRPGTWVRVKSYAEILATLDRDNKNRGLYFDAEHVPYCGRRMRVRSLVTRIIEEHSGRMLHFRTPGIILEGATCQGTFSDKRMFCPRAIYPYWRALWLTPLTAAEAERASQPTPLAS